MANGPAKAAALQRTALGAAKQRYQWQRVPGDDVRAGRCLRRYAVALAVLTGIKRQAHIGKHVKRDPRLKSGVSSLIAIPDLSRDIARNKLRQCNSILRSPCAGQARSGTAQSPATSPPKALVRRVYCLRRQVERRSRLPSAGLAASTPSYALPQN